MKLLILKEFQDKNTGEIHKAGDFAEFDEARAKELLADPRQMVEAPQVQIVNEDTEDETDEEKPKKAFKRSGKK